MRIDHEYRIEYKSSVGVLINFTIGNEANYLLSRSTDWRTIDLATIYVCLYRTKVRFWYLIIDLCILYDKL
jgi:hypothetical protein